MKKRMLLLLSILSSSLYAIDWWKYTPIGAAATAGSAATVAAIKSYDYWKKNKSTCNELIAESKTYRLIYEQKHKNAALVVQRALATPGELEATLYKIRVLPAEQRNDLFQFINKVEKQVETMQNFLPKNDDPGLEQFNIEKKELHLLAQQLSPLKPYLQHALTLINLEIIISALMRKNECSINNESYQVEIALDRFERELGSEIKNGSYDLSQYPALRKKIADFTTELRELHKRLVIKKINQEFNQTYATELSMQVNETTINNLIRNKQMEHQWSFPYVSYLQNLNSMLSYLEEKINSHDYLFHLKPQLNRLKQFKELLYNHSSFSYNHRTDLTRYEQHKLEQERFEVEQKARQEMLDLERRKTKAAEEQMRLEFARLAAERERIEAEHRKERAEHNREKVERERIKEERDPAKKENERKVAEERHARALEEQNRLERERQKQNWRPPTAADVDYMRQQVGQIPNASAPPA